MGLLFTCSTCEKKYDCSISNLDNSVSYLNGTKYIELKYLDEDCANCKEAIEKEISGAREKAREKLRGDKND